jgi:LmbE family N-acetylglucosaminyl deacetylase
MRILMANEPRSHREVFAGALRALRPHLEVITVTPDALEGEAPRLHPDAVVCSRITPALRTAAGRWMEARLEDGTLRVRTSDTGRSHDPDPGLDVLLQFVDRGEEQSRTARQTQKTSQELGGLQ